MSKFATGELTDLRVVTFVHEKGKSQRGEEAAAWKCLPKRTGSCHQTDQSGETLVAFISFGGCRLAAPVS